MAEKYITHVYIVSDRFGFSKLRVDVTNGDIYDALHSDAGQTVVV